MDLLLKAWLGTSISTILLCTGALIASFFLGPIKYFKNSVDISHLTRSMISRIYILFIFCVGVLLFYIYQIGFQNTAIYSILDGADNSDIQLARSSMGIAIQTGSHWFRIFMRDGLVFLTLILVAGRYFKSNLVSIPTLIFSIVITSFSLLISGEKSLILDFILASILLYICIKKNGVISLNKPFHFFSILGIFVAFYFFQLFPDDLQKNISLFFSRLLTGSLQPIYHYVEFFPKYNEYLLGGTLPNPGGILPFIPFDLTGELMDFFYPEDKLRGIIGSMPAVYWGEAYANFGWWGVILIPPLIGFYLFFINKKLFNCNYDAINVALFIWILIHYKNLAITSFSNYLLDLPLAFILLIYSLLKINTGINSGNNQ
jgi:oligosaccharide repeat unit polymerase